MTKSASVRKKVNKVPAKNRIASIDKPVAAIPKKSLPKKAAAVSSKEQEPPKPFIDQYDIPADYKNTYLTLVARDPFWIYAYWEIMSEAFEQVRAKMGDAVTGSVVVLRMYDVTCIDFNGTNANRYFDLEVGPANSWYINLWQDGVSYIGEIGMRSHDGQFFAIARSNAAHTPRSGASWRRDDIRMEVKDDTPQPPFVLVEVGGDTGLDKSGERDGSGKGSGEDKDGSDIEIKLDESKRIPEPAKPRRTRRIYLTEDDVRAYYSRLTPLLKDILARRLAAKRDPALGLNFSFLQKATLDELLRRGLSMADAVKRMLLGSSGELVSSFAVSKSAASEGLLADKRRNFFFELGTELIVYGRTEPDADVRLSGKKIELRKDGTFSMRFAFPDGRIPLDFTAESADKVEKREIITAAERAKTKYNP